MIWLADWLKSIIFVILLATFVDILLPNQTMQRYVKTVMSLFILLTLMQPVVSLFHKQTSMEEMFAGVEALFQSTTDKNTAAVFSSFQGNSTQMQTLEGVGRQAEQLKERQEQQSQQLMQKQIGDLMKQNIEQSSPGMTVQNVQVDAGKDAQGQMEISKVTLLIALQTKKPPTKGGQGSVVKPAQIEPIKPVDISVKSRIEPTGAVPEGKDASAFSIAGTGHEQEKTQVRLLLNKVWLVPPERVVIEIAKD